MTGGQSTALSVSFIFFWIMGVGLLAQAMGIVAPLPIELPRLSSLPTWILPIAAIPMMLYYIANFLFGYLQIVSFAAGMEVAVVGWIATFFGAVMTWIAVSMIRGTGGIL